ncbi:MAG: hypothetical protein PHC54_05005 [Candidatus Omnitrophica bacterium]|nr:hypothetical protein [Candidatus Omnitrophota bacterium]MDD5592632.1 hypothetical protein [Candidatus Omnitrophota bacterium]
MEKIRRKKKYMGTSFQKRLLVLIFASAVIPTAIVSAVLYYLIFNLLAWHIGIPEIIAYNLIPVLRKINFIILISLPVIFLLIWLMAMELSHRIAGPLFRIERELEERIAGKGQGHIRLRPKDELKTLVDKINRLLNK